MDLIKFFVLLKKNITGKSIYNRPGLLLVNEIILQKNIDVNTHNLT